MENRSDSSTYMSLFGHFHSFAFMLHLEGKILLAHFNCILLVLVETLLVEQIIDQKHLMRKSREVCDILHLLQEV